MTHRTIEATEAADGIAVLTLRRPEKRNAISIEMRREISACLERWASAPAVGAVIVTGSGGAFSAGFDLQEFASPERFADLLETSSRYHRDVWRFPKPTIAAVDGPALAGGLDLAVLCDLRIASDRASFGHPEIRLGAPPLYTPLRWIVGSGVARDLCLTGRRIDAAEARRIGLVTEVTSPDRLLLRAAELAAAILAAPAHVLRFTKAAFLAAEDRAFEESFLLEHDRAFREVLLKDRGFTG